MKMSFFSKPTSRTYPVGRKGSALVITLLMIVLLTVIVTGYVLRASLSRQIAVNSVGKGRADQLAKTALAITVGDLREEIRAGSNELTNIANPNQRVFIPLGASKLLPETQTTANFGDSTVVKVSRGGTPFWAGISTPSSPNRAIAGYSSDKKSKNGWSVPDTAWLKPMLFSGATLPSDFIAPDWIPLLRRGPLDASDLLPLDSLKNPSPTNPDFMTGRYAYIIYNLGGRLDVNAAGSSLSGNQVKHKGRVALADLAQIPGISDASALLAWRTAATGSLTDTAVGSGSVFDPQRSFLTVPPLMMAGNTDNAILSRQELLAYQQVNLSQITTAALPFLTTFSREANAPSFLPSTPSLINPNFLSVRWKQNLTLPDGRKAIKGQPIAFRRFPLSRLLSVSDSATSSANDSSAIYRCFGLSRSDASQHWVYNHGAADKILTLDEVEAKGREPDFFELLKAIIAAGSLGKAAANNSLALTTVFDGNPTLQILQIGANLIDQYDADSYPTSIQITNSANSLPYEIFGIEDLPYPLALHTTYYRPKSGSLGNNVTRDTIHAWLMVELWNPHQPSPAIYIGPTSLRATAVNGSMAALVAWQQVTPPGLIQNMGSSTNFGSLLPSLEFPYITSAFREPTLLTSLNVSGASPNVLDDGAAKIAGFYIGSAVAPDRRLTSNPADKTWTHSASRFPAIPVTVELQYNHPTLGWKPYARLEGIASNGMWAFTNTSPYTAVAAGVPTFISNTLTKPEPRSSRFGLFYVSTKAIGSTLRPARTDAGFQSIYGTPVTPGFLHGEPAATWAPFPQYGRPGMWADNNASSSVTPNSTYPDVDGTTRPGDGYYGAFPQAQGGSLDTASRSLVLNRPFRNVAELGYVFRDLPFKTLDFSSDRSADLGLLDVFSIDDAEITAGKVDINTAPTEVLAALLTGTGWQEQNTSLAISNSEAKQIADKIVEKRDLANPIQSPADLEKWLVGNVLDSILTGDSLRIKEQREAVIRALASSTQTRTWNLLIDVVSQAGHLAPNAESLDDFVVEGEARYWLHIAIDRFTGEIVDQQMESVTN